MRIGVPHYVASGEPDVKVLWPFRPGFLGSADAEGANLLGFGLGYGFSILRACGRFGFAAWLAGLFNRD
jgi:hypothetical protein